MTFQESTFNIYSQIKTTLVPSLSTIEHLTVNNLYGRGQMSMYYIILLSSGSTENSHSYLSAWKNDLHLDITVEFFIQFKWLLRTYITPVKLHHFNPNISDDGIKCNEESGTLLHCMWSCRQRQTFWKEVLMLISKLTETAIPIKVKICLLHIYPECFPVSTKKQRLIHFYLIQAKHVIALKWKDTMQPNISHWIGEMSCNLTLEKRTYLVNGQIEDFTRRRPLYCNL